ncbi:MAG TPA: AraC family transcriptional regulator [Sphingomicrobium sp.]
MSSFVSHELARTPSVAVWDVDCPGECSGASAEECSYAMHLVVPYAGIFRHHVGRRDWVVEPNQLLLINPDEPYRVSHPIEGGDRSLSIELAPPLFDELVPRDRPRRSGIPAFAEARMTLSARAQRAAASLRHRLRSANLELLEIETILLEFLGACVGARPPSGSWAMQKLVDRAKLVLASDLSRRWSLAEVGAQVGVSPVYLTQAFKIVEGTPLYHYQLRLRLARALELVPTSDDLTGTALDLGFSSHSHFADAFRRAFGISPSQLRGEARA